MNFYRKPIKFLITVGFILYTSCTPKTETPSGDDDDLDKTTFYYGADLSYVNEMEDCGATYRDVDNQVKDVYQIFKNEGANMIRLRLWHNPTWTDYSTLQDVKKSIRRAKEQESKILLDFHYSDTWADPSKQEVPAAWASSIDDTEKLSQLLYQYTYDVLHELVNEDLSPDIVQVGNEINAMMLQQGELIWPIDWERNATIINKGIQAVRDVAKETNKDIEVMLHIAQPENALYWFRDAAQNGVTDFDWIGLSYYPKWSEYKMYNVDQPVRQLIETYRKRLMIVETAYPFTLENVDAANNILGSDALIDDYPATQQGQLDYLNNLTTKIKDAGGSGVIYWEPAWVSTNCKTQWGTGSHWDNATLFDVNGKLTLGMRFYNK
jgi:arabinogalactan endo-1,4-beta-galactosidase